MIATSAQSDVGKRLAGLRGGFLDAIDRFDAFAFDISPREACVIDPQQRLMLETAWEALEDAGQDFRRLCGTSVGVYLGIWNCDYQSRLFRRFPQIDLAMATGGGDYSAAGRLSYAFDLRGPSLTINTACSSSLVAVHLACQALHAGECDLAIAGGANTILDASVSVALLTAGALSPDAKCKFGDASANGFVRSEGAGAVILKRLTDALADNDPVHAIIRGSAVTHNGQTGGSLVAPGEEGQFHLLRQALNAAGLDAKYLDYIEAHGTGTPVGDRMELRTLGRILSHDRSPASTPCLVGSIKTNIGHTESAAGVAGLIKAILCLKHRQVPPSLHFHDPNPHVQWNQLPLRINTQLTPLEVNGRPAFAGVNSFGITGTFAHVILEEAREPSARSGRAAPATSKATFDGPSISQDAPIILPVSARCPAALKQLAAAYAAQIRLTPDDLSNVAYSAGVRRTHHEVRLAAVGRDARSIAASLQSFGQGQTARELFPPPDQALVSSRSGWVFSGQGPQWPGMGRRLYETEAVFRGMMDRLEPLIQAQTGWSLQNELAATETASKLAVTAVAQPAIFAIQVSLAELFKSWGLRPSMIVGHSVGEAAAAYVAGVFALEDAVRIICARARIAERASGLGKMAAVELTVPEAKQLIADLGANLSVAAVNGPRSLTISGAIAPLHAFCERVAALGRFNRVLDVNYPFHSALLDPLLSEMATIAVDISPAEPHTPLYSTVHGRLASARDFTPAYWPRNLRETVLFAPAIEQMTRDGCGVFVEFSPHPALSYSIKQVLQSIGKRGCVIETLRRQGDAPADLRRAVCEHYVLGIDPDWSKLVPANGKAVELPTYAWQRESYWVDERPLPNAGGDRSTEQLHPLLQRPVRIMGATKERHWDSEISIEHFPWLAEHCVQGRAIFPATAYLLPDAVRSRPIGPRLSTLGR